MIPRQLIPALVVMTADPLLRAAMLMFDCEPDATLDGHAVPLRAVPEFVPVRDTGEVTGTPKQAQLL